MTKLVIKREDVSCCCQIENCCSREFCAGKAGFFATHKGAEVHHYMPLFLADGRSALRLGNAKEH